MEMHRLPTAIERMVPSGKLMRVLLLRVDQSAIATSLSLGAQSFPANTITHKVRVRDIDYILLQQPMQAAEDQMQWRDSLPALWQHAVGVHICAQLL